MTENRNTPIVVALLIAAIGVALVVIPARLAGQAPAWDASNWGTYPATLGRAGSR